MNKGEAMTTYETTFVEQLGASDEVFYVLIEYCEDFTGDGYDDIKVTLTLADGSNSNTEDLIGIAFDIAGNNVTGLEIENIERYVLPGALVS